MSVKNKLVAGVIGAAVLSGGYAALVYTSTTPQEGDAYRWTVTYANLSGQAEYEVKANGHTEAHEKLDAMGKYVQPAAGNSGVRSGHILYAKGGKGIIVKVSVSARNVPSAQAVCTIERLREDGSLLAIVSGPIYSKPGEANPCKWDVQGGR